MSSVSETLARWIVERREGGFPDEVLRAAETFLLDWIGSALAGRGTTPGSILLDYARAQPEGPSPVVAEGRPLAADTAAFVNGALSHIVEMDDVDRVSVLHPGAVVIPAALAVAEREGRSGRELLSSLVAGYEIATRFGAAVGAKHYERFHNTSTCGVFGSAAATAWLLGLDEEANVGSLGSAGTTASGLWEFNRDGAMSKHLHAGHAASSGVRASDLAARGFTGARCVVEGDRGFFAALAPEGNIDRVTEGLPTASGFALPGVSLKPYASCRHTHAAIDAALELRGRLAGRDVRRGTIYVYRAARSLCDNGEPKTAYEAKFSLQYTVARALTTGTAGPGDFDVEALDDPRAVHVRKTLAVRVDEALEARYPAEFPARLELELEDGLRLEAAVSFPLGDPENPLSRDRVEEKVRELGARGGLGEHETHEYVSWVASLADAERVRLPRPARGG